MRACHQDIAYLIYEATGYFLQPYEFSHQKVQEKHGEDAVPNVPAGRQAGSFLTTNREVSV